MLETFDPRPQHRREPSSPITIFLQRFGNHGPQEQPISGLPNIDGAWTRTRSNVFGNPTGLTTPFGADMEGVVLRLRTATSGWSMSTVRRSTSSIEDGILLGRFVPEGTAELRRTLFRPAASASRSLPEDYLADRQSQPWFRSGMPLDNEKASVVYAFIQTPLANPDRDDER